MSYMDKKTNKRQTTIISLSDENQKQIQNIQEEKRLMLEEYENQKAGQDQQKWSLRKSSDI